MLSVRDNVITVSTKTLDAVIENGAITRLSDKKGNICINAPESEAETLRIVYRRGETVPVKNTASGKIHTYQISDSRAQVFYDSWDGNGVITVSEDTETGDLCIEPEVTSARQGILACRYFIDGIEQSYRICAPLYQGVDMERDDPLLRQRKWGWPHHWEAGFVIFHNAANGFWVRCEDTGYRCKAMTTGCCASGKGVAFDSETYGPVEKSMSAGGIEWKINVFEGGWKVPAAQYREWLWNAYSLGAEEAGRREWMRDIRLGVSWCPSDAAVIDELAKKVDPRKVLLHLPRWRIHGYDQCYPDFTPSDDFVKFIEYASSRGFHCMPHANSVDMDPSMPEYKYVCDFKYRDIENGKLLGWSWDNGKILGVPSSNKALTENRDKLVMVKIHPGLAMWRAILAENIKKALDKLGGRADAIFIDVTLCTFNLDNCLVDNMTSTEGMKRIISYIGAINGGIAVGGEGLNEITAQKLTFAQAHLFDSHHATADGLERCGGCDLNAFLFGRLCRTIGYSNLAGLDEKQALRERIHEEHGAVPTITVSKADQIANPNAVFKHVFELANS